MAVCNRCVWLGKQKKAHFYVCLNSDSKFYKIPFPHGKNRKACSLYESRDPSLAPQVIPKGMKLIENFRGKKEFRDSDFWIIGSDPNLDCYPDDFFDNKFSIAINLSCVAFPRSTFLYISGRRRLEWIIKKYPECLKKIILPLVHVRPINFSLKAEREMQKRLRPYNYQKRMGIGPWENWGLESIYVKLEDKPLPLSSPDYESMMRRILGGGLYDLTLTRSSLHSAIFVATILGARKIILVGCSHKAQKGRAYAQKRGMSDFVSEKIERKAADSYYAMQASGINRVRRDTIQLARVFKKYDVQVVRHRFDEEKGEFVFEEIKGA